MKGPDPIVFCFLTALIVVPSGALRADHPGKTEESDSTATEVIFVSDTQSPLFPEMFLLPSNRNEEARGLIFDAILEDRPSAVFHMGDMVALGFWNASWEAMDDFVGRLTAAGIPFYPTRGNHELMWFSGMGESNFARRFPEASRTGYSRQVGPLAVVLLNSNFPQMSDEEIAAQQRWYEATLAAFDADTTVSAVFVACHHPPFTNSTIVNPSSDVRGQFMPPFLNSRKSIAFLSGHAHAMESFVFSGKRFLVIGGGGGLQQPVLVGDRVRWVDEFPLTSEKRMFHYLRCSATRETMVLSVQMLSDDLAGFSEVYRLELQCGVAVDSASTHIEVLKE
jgi:hypothetical protein